MHPKMSLNPQLVPKMSLSHQLVPKLSLNSQLKTVLKINLGMLAYTIRMHGISSPL